MVGVPELLEAVEMLALSMNFITAISIHTVSCKYISGKNICMLYIYIQRVYTINILCIYRL